MTQRAVAIVTGGSRGIGKAIAVELAGLGYDIVITHRGTSAASDSGEAPGERARRDVEARGARCLLVRSDVGVGEDRAKLLDTVRGDLGRCDLLVNNAGVAPDRRVDLLEAAEASFDRVLGINLRGPYFLTQAIANWMIEQRRANPDAPYRIVNIGSISAYTSSPARGAYCVSKAGVAMMTKLFADRLAEYDIGVFEVRPGVVATDMTTVVKDKYDRLIGDGLTPTRRWGRPEDVARAVGAVADGRLDFSTGQVLDVDGGFHLRRL